MSKAKNPPRPGEEGDVSYDIEYLSTLDPEDFGSGAIAWLIERAAKTAELSAELTRLRGALAEVEGRAEVANDAGADALHMVELMLRHSDDIGADARKTLEFVRGNLRPAMESLEPAAQERRGRRAKERAQARSEIATLRVRLGDAERERDEARAVIESALHHLDAATSVDTEQGEANRRAAYAQTELGRYLEHGYQVATPTHREDGGGPVTGRGGATTPERGGEG